MRSCTEPERAAPAADLALPHDLLEIPCADALVCEAPRPAWLRSSLERAPFVVVRRCGRRGPLVPVGVRGASRTERFAAWLPRASAVRRLRPEDLAANRRAWQARATRPFTALAAVEEIMGAHRLPWGPVGSVGFELASGIACVTAASDLDVLARAPAALSPVALRALHAAIAALPVRVDVQLEVPAGGVALAELAGPGSRVVVRTPHGPRWSTAPWAPEPARGGP